MNTFDMLQDLQKHERLAHPDGTASWIVFYYPNPHPSLSWWCSLVDCGEDKPRKAFHSRYVSDCVQKAWESEKEAGE